MLGAAISLILVSTVFFNWSFVGGVHLSWRINPAQFFAILPAQLPWLIPFGLLSIALLPLRALQWRYTLRKKVPFSERYHMVAIGAFVQNALPGKLGDPSRAFLLGRTQKIPFVESLGSVAVCKLLEFVALMLLVVGSLFGPGRLPAQAQVLHWAGGACAGLCAVALALAWASAPLAAQLSKSGKLPRIRHVLEHANAGLFSIRSPRKLGKALLASIPPVLAPAVGYGLGLVAFGLHAGIWAGPLVLLAIAAGQSVLLVPAGTGLYYLTTSLAARALGASPVQAAAFAALTYLVTLGTQVGMGAISLWIRRISWKELRSVEKASARARHLVETGAVEELDPDPG